MENSETTEAINDKNNNGTMCACNILSGNNFNSKSLTIVTMGNASFIQCTCMFNEERD